MFIDGNVSSASDGASELVFNPATEEPVASVPQATRSDVDRAVKAARRAFDDWSTKTPGQRAAALTKLANRMQDMDEELVQLEVQNVGKPVEVARGDVEFSIDNLLFFAGACRALEGKAAAEYLAGHTSMIRREPIGVVASIAPWNYPLLMAIWKIGPALAVGNTVVLKPSEITPLSTLKLAEVSGDIFPAGVLNVVTGHGTPVGAALVEHAGVDMVSLTGDLGTGQKILESAARTIKTVHLELGGKAPAVVFEDADLEWAAQRLRRSAFYNTGQDCTAATRVIVHETIADSLVSLLLREIEAIRVGDPLDPKTTTGPLVSKAHQDKVAGMVNRAREEGAQVLIGGHRPDGKGYFYAPTLLTNVRQEDEIVQKEVFGPVLTLQTFRSEAEALDLANGVAHGLTASVWTQNLSRALRISNKLEFGTVWVNDHTRLTPEMPHGGRKASGHGSDMSAYSLEEYTQIKHVMIRT
jgi:1-pyrroline dehydrogenase